MMFRTLHRTSARRLAALLLLCAVLLRALIPAGFMPDVPSLEAGVIRMVICTGHGTLEADVLQHDQAARPDDTGDPAHRQKSPAGPAQHEPGLCPFAAALALFAPILLPILLALLTALQPVRFAAGSRVPKPDRFRASCSARGPPLFA